MASCWLANCPEVDRVHGVLSGERPDHQVIHGRVVVGVAAVAAVASYEHTYDLVRMRGLGALVTGRGVRGTSG
jgi:hypothetical protein